MILPPTWCNSSNNNISKKNWDMPQGDKKLRKKAKRTSTHRALMMSAGSVSVRQDKDGKRRSTKSAAHKAQSVRRRMPKPKPEDEDEEGDGYYSDSQASEKRRR